MNVDGNIDNREVPGRDTILGLYCTAVHMFEHNWPLQNAEIHIHQVNTTGVFHVSASPFIRNMYYNTYIE